MTGLTECVMMIMILTTGALQGYNKDTAWKELDLDQELVMQMRRSYDVRPPRMEDDHKHWHGNDRRCVWIVAYVSERFYLFLFSHRRPANNKGTKS